MWLLLAPVGLLAGLGWLRRWSSEDAFIYFRVADNLVAGHGPVFNVGERVEAYTGALWLAVLGLARAILPASASLEWIAVVLGILLSAGGLLAATLAAYRLWRDGKGKSGSALPLPLGALVIAALPPFWDYASSGLETGLAFAWLGGVFLGLVAVGASPASHGRGKPPTSGSLLSAVAIGLGPLVRPDLAIFAATFLLCLLVVARPRSPRHAAAIVGAALLIPLAYQLFRMGYFGSLVPNTALAKEAGAAFWGRGLTYLLDLLSPYLLWLPLAVLVAYGLGTAGFLWQRGDPKRSLLIAAPIAAGFLHVLYVVRVGGDYMHARLLLPSVFALVLPVAVVVHRRRSVAAFLAALVVPWAAVTALELRASARPEDGIADHRRLYEQTWPEANLVTLGDLLEAPPRKPLLQGDTGLLLSQLADRHPAIVINYGLRGDNNGRFIRWPVPIDGLRPRPDVPVPVVAWLNLVGRSGYAAGPDVRIVDKYGVADPIAARVRLPSERLRRPGHEKSLPKDWLLARYALPHSPEGAEFLKSEPVAAARRALGCAPLRRLVATTTEPLDAGRFLSNIVHAVRYGSLRLPPDPRLAAPEICGDGSPK